MLNFFKTFLIMAGLSSFVMSGQELPALLPEVPKGWNIVEKDRVYSQDELFDYINGGAELFLSYGMNEVISRIISSGENEIRIEIFDMQSGSNAFGVFSHSRTKDEKQFGQGSQFFIGTLIFWKNKFYISLTANDSNEEINKAILGLAKDIEIKITEEGSTPDILQLLPGKFMLEDAYVYFTHSIWQNSYHFIANDNFLNIDNTSPAVLAKYGDAENRYYLLIVEYPDENSCQTNLKVFKERFLGDIADEQIYQIEDNTWWGGAALRKYLFVVLNAPSRNAADQTLEAVKNKINQLP